MAASRKVTQGPHLAWSTLRTLHEVGSTGAPEVGQAPIASPAAVPGGRLVVDHSELGQSPDEVVEGAAEVWVFREDLLDWPDIRPARR